MAEVDVFLKEEWPALGDSEALEKQLEQCTVSISLPAWQLFFSVSPASSDITQLITVPENKFML